MKRKFGAILVFCTVLVLPGCFSSPKSINFETIPEKTFILEYVSYITNMEEYNKYIPILFEKFPIATVSEQVALKYGVQIDSTLYQNEDLHIKSYNISMPNYFVEFETNATNRAIIYFDRMHQEKAMRATAYLLIYDGDKVTHKSSLQMYFPEFEIITN